MKQISNCTFTADPLVYIVSPPKRLAVLSPLTLSPLHLHPSPLFHRMTDLDGQIRIVRDRCGHASYAATNASRSFTANLPTLARDAEALCTTVHTLRQDLVALESRLFSIMLARATKDNAIWEANERAAARNYKAGKDALLEQARADPAVARQLLAYEEETMAAAAMVGTSSSSPVSAAAQGLASAFGSARSFLSGVGEASGGSGSTRSRVAAMAASINASLKASIAVSGSPVIVPSLSSFMGGALLASFSGSVSGKAVDGEISRENESGGGEKITARETSPTSPVSPPVASASRSVPAVTAVPSVPRPYQTAVDLNSGEKGSLSPAAFASDKPSAPVDPYKSFVSVKDIVKKKDIAAPVVAPVPKPVVHAAPVVAAVAAPIPPVLVPVVAVVPAAAVPAAVTVVAPAAPLVVPTSPIEKVSIDVADSAVKSTEDTSTASPKSVVPAKKGPGGRVAALASKFAKANTAKKTTASSSGGGAAKPDGAANEGGDVTTESDISAAAAAASTDTAESTA